MHARTTRFLKRALNRGLVVDQSDRPVQAEGKALVHFPKNLPRALYSAPAVFQPYAHYPSVTELKPADLEGDLEQSHHCALPALDQEILYLYYRDQNDLQVGQECVARWALGAVLLDGSVEDVACDYCSTTIYSNLDEQGKNCDSWVVPVLA